MMLGTALANLVIFRSRDLHLGYVIGNVLAVLDVLLVCCVVRLDAVAAATLAPYLVYRVYAVWWGAGIDETQPLTTVE